MNKMYFILSVAGWAWLVVVALFLVIRLGIRDKRTPGSGRSERAEQPGAH